MKYTEKSNDAGIIIGALLIGAIAGAAIGVLFAPDRGGNTRGKIMDGAKDLAGDFKRKFRDEASSVKHKAEDLQEKAEDKMDNMSNMFKQKVDSVKNNG